MPGPCAFHLKVPSRGAGLKEGDGVAIVSRTGQVLRNPRFSSLPLPTLSGQHWATLSGDSAFNLSYVTL